MERLTYRAELGVSIDKNEDCPTCSICWNCDIPPRKCKYISDALEKLADYEDLDEQGRLIKIPLEAYCIVDFEVRKGFVLEETYHMSRKPLLVVRYDDNSLKSHRGYLGISVFLTKSEAEAKLKGLRDNND